MNYYFKEKSIISFDNNVVVETKLDYENGASGFCISEESYKLLNVLGNKNWKLTDGCLSIGKSKIRLLNAQVPNFTSEFTSECVVNIDHLKNALKFVAKTNARPQLCGVYVNDKGTIIGTDSFRLYASSLESGENGIILSFELAKELAKYSGVHTLRFNNTTAQVELDNVVITGRLYEGNFPDVLKLFNQPFETLDIDYETFNNALNVGSNLKANMKCCFMTTNSLTIKGMSESDIYNVDLLLDNSNSDIKVCVNYDNLAQAIGCFEKDYYIGFVENLRPMLIGSNSSSEKIIILPMRYEWSD